jgi:hypothetical protein
MTSKQRKLSTGSSNLPTVRSERGSVIKKEFTRSWTHKLIAPDAYHPPEKQAESSFVDHNTATWRPVPIFELAYETTTDGSYKNPSEVKMPEGPHEMDNETMLKQQRERQQQVDAVEALCKTAKAHFGTTGAMMKMVMFFLLLFALMCHNLFFLFFLLFFKKFNKSGDDDISLYELGEYLKRNHIDHHVSHEERKKIFDSVDPNHKGSVPVRELLRTTEQQEFKDDTHAENMLKVRNFLRNHLDVLRQRRQDRVPRDPDLEERKKTKAVEREKDKIKTAIGQKTFDIDVDHDELHDALEALASTKHETAEDKKFARFLRHANLNLAVIPFYDMRHEELDHLKGRAARIDRQFYDPEAIHKLTDLTKTRWMSSLATTNDTDPETMALKREVIDESRQRLERTLAKTLSQSHSSLNVRPSPLSLASGSSPAKLDPLPTAARAAAASSSMSHRDGDNGGGGGGVGGMKLSASMGALPSMRNNNNNNNNNNNKESTTAAGAGAGGMKSARSTASLALSNTGGGGGGGGVGVGGNITGASLSGRPRNLLLNSEGVSADDVSATNSTDYIGSTTASDMQRQLQAHYNNKTAKRKEEVFFEPERTNESDFYTQIFDESSSNLKLKDPSKGMRIEKIDPNVYLPTGKRAVNHGPTDWSRVGVGGGRASSDVGYGRSDDDPFLTTNAHYYPPLHYSASQPVSRDLVSESEVNFRKREFQRNERYARMKANMDVTKTRLEYEVVIKEVQALRRNHGRLEDRIRYQTAMFLNDLKCYKSQPLVRMSKKQNIHLADRMWNGNQEHHIPENRDFLSTYNASYDSENLRLSDTLIQPPHGNAGD